MQRLAVRLRLLIPVTPTISASPIASPVTSLGFKGAVVQQFAFSFPALFNGMVDEETDTPPPVSEKDRKTKEPPAVPVPVQLAPAAPLPFVLNIQLPQPDASSEASTEEPATRPELPQKSARAPLAQQPLVQQGTTQPFLQQPISPLPPVQQRPVERTQPPAREPAAVAPIVPEATPQATIPVKTPEPILAAAGSSWKETNVPLPRAELAFAARVTPAPESAKHSTLASHGAASSRESALPAKLEPTHHEQDNTRDQQQQQQPESKSETAPPARLAAAPIERQHTEEPEREPPEAAIKPAITASAAPTPVTTSPERTPSVVHAAEAPKHVAPGAELHAPDPPAAAPAQPLRDFSMRLTGNHQDKVEVKIVETAGEIRVAVHSADPELTTSLQQGIGDLVNKLDSHGMRAETWKPIAEASGTASPSRSEQGQNQQQQSNDGSQGRQQQQPRHQQPQQHHAQLAQKSRQNKPDWLSEIDQNLAALQNDNMRRML